MSEGVFRSGYPIACNFPFLRGLGLRSILCLCPESVLAGSLAWAKDAGVRVEMCDLGENSPPFVSMPLTAMRQAVDFLSGERSRYGRQQKDSNGCVLYPSTPHFREWGSGLRAVQFVKANTPARRLVLSGHYFGTTTFVV